MTKDYFREWAKKNPAPPSKPRSTMTLLLGFLVIAGAPKPVILMVVF